MKKYRVAQIITGIVFFLLALFFSFGLIFSLFDSNKSVTGLAGLMASTGRLLKDGYGLCSILIPIFFFTVSVFCLILQITFKKCIYISFSLIPFFTAVISERIYRNSLQTQNSQSNGFRLIFAILVTLIIMAIEFILAGIIAERIAFNRRLKNQMRSEALNSDTDNILFGKIEKESSDNFDKIMNSKEEEETIQEESIDPRYLHAFDDVPLYDQNSDFSIPEEESDFQDEYNEDEEADIIDQHRKLVNDENQDNSASEIIETNLTETRDEISDIYSQMDQDIEDKIDETANYDEEDFAEPEIDYEESDILVEQELSPDEQFEKELADSQHWHETIDYPDDENSDNYDIETESSDFDTEASISDTENEDVLSSTEIEEPVIDAPATPQVSVKEAEEKIREEKKSTITKRRGAYKVPTDGLLNQFEDQKYWIIDNKTNEAADFLKETLKEFKIDAEVTGIRKGPVVTMFEILPAPGVKLSKIVALQDNIALRLAASSVRIVAPIPGKRAVGIEIPNAKRATVTFRELIEQDLPEYKKMAVPVVLGKDIQGEAQLLDIAKTPHLLIAGSTGSGKSVCVNSIILSILYKRSPEQVKMILVDPKIVELKLYNDIPHLLTPVITEPKKALQSLQYCLCEMERRYALLDGLGVRDIINYNKRVEERHIATEKLPYIVVIIDEFADLMATTGKELESTIARLCAMSRAVGIHLVLATQRPSIDVITGLIKANIPTRIAFMVASKMDSRVIIDQVGAEKLLGSGDMLYASATDPFPVRIQGTYVSDQEVENVVEYVKGFGEPDYIDEEIFVDTEEDEMAEPSLFGGGEDPLYNKALEIVMQAGKASASYLQRRLSIGYNRAARLIEDMEARGIVGPANGSKPREIIHAI